MIQNDLIKIKNAYLAKQQRLTLPYSTLTENVVKVLAHRGYIGEVAIVHKEGKKELTVSLRYAAGVPHLHDVKLLSKSGRRLYARASELHRVRQGFGDVIVSTSQGVMTASQAKKKGLGGEIICEVF